MDITIVDRQGNVSVEPVRNWRALDANADNTISDSEEGAVRFATSHAPRGNINAAWAIWPTGTGRWAIRESLPAINAWGTERRLINAEEFCPECEHATGGHYDNCNPVQR